MSACLSFGPIAMSSFPNWLIRFSKTYYIQEATHKIDSNGYRTRFKVEEPQL